MRISITRCTWPELSPLRHSARRERLKYQASPVAMVRSSACAFMCATMSTSPERAAVATQVTRPSASNLGANARPSSTSSVEPGLGNVEDGSGNAASLKVCRPRASGTHRATERGLWNMGPRLRGDDSTGHVSAIAKSATRPTAQTSAVDPAQQSDEANLVVRVVAEAAGEVRRDGRGARLLHPAHRHAHVLGLEHHRHAARTQDL